MAVETPTISVPIQTDKDGDIRVGGTRVLLDMIIISYQQGESPEQIHEGFPSVTLADIFAVITYYLNHREEVDTYIRQREEEGEQLRREIEARRPDIFDLEKKLRERLAKRDE